MKVLATGGAGFMGSHVVDELVAMDVEVTVLDDLSGGFLENVNSKAKFIEGSILDVDLIDSLFQKQQFDYIFHLAAYAAEGLSHFIKRFNYNNNLIGSINLINASVNSGVKCFVFTSSIAVYGSNQLPMTEDLTPIPEDSYGIAKSAVEQELKVSKMMFDLEYIIFRPHNVYGEKQNIGDKYRNVIGIFMNQLMQNRPLTVFGDGEQTRAFSYIKDVAPIIAKSVYNKSAYNEIFNIGADTPYSINHLVNVVSKAMGVVNPQVQNLDPRKEVVHAYADHAKVQDVFNYFPKYTLEEGIEAMAKWAMKVGSKTSSVFKNIEISSNLPPSWNNIIN